MQRSPFANMAIIGVLVMPGACGLGAAQPNILDAAAIYEAQPDAFTEIILSYPAPFVDFMRIPARDPATASKTDKRFINRLRKKFPVEFIDFYPRSEAGRDEVDVVIKRYGLDADWTIVSIIYLSKPLLPPNEGSNMALFDKCDGRSLEWLERTKRKGPASVFCQLNEQWYAFQKVG